MEQPFECRFFFFFLLFSRGRGLRTPLNASAAERNRLPLILRSRRGARPCGALLAPGASGVKFGSGLEAAGCKSLGRLDAKTRNVKVAAATFFKQITTLCRSVLKWGIRGMTGSSCRWPLGSGDEAMAAIRVNKLRQHDTDVHWNDGSGFIAFGPCEATPKSV